MRPLFQVRLHNEGKGRARHMNVTFGGVTAHGGEIAPGADGETAILNLEGHRFWMTVQAHPETLTVAYADQYGNEYQTTIPVSQQGRADGQMNMQIDWSKYALVGARPTPLRYFCIGR